MQFVTIDVTKAYITLREDGTSVVAVPLDMTQRFKTIHAALNAPGCDTYTHEAPISLKVLEDDEEWSK